ncbi:unnamed protein product [Rotaria socialis]|uniref:F-box domain-containing protein n=1 Tax=Rotaria socialis TaxID=392032 RepID=A0A817TAK9_9BILA|nr:unnamed protein product [Rotaria socialis]CAF3320487.1 unnamed protein product [Rotaria socialis]CAF3326676.1 unnamed protein product [Rotaria socialis]
MNQSSVQLLDLPDEVLLDILKKLDNVDVLYALFGIDNGRLNRTTVDSVLDRLFNYILPQIHDNVECLTVEPAFMERILLAAHYPNLTELKINDFQRDNSSRYFAGKEVSYIPSTEAAQYNDTAYNILLMTLLYYILN